MKCLRASRLLIVIVFFHALSLTGAATAQTPTPTAEAREVIIQDIKSSAERHVKNTLLPQTQFIVDLYRNNSVGLTPLEIAKLYEEEYTRQKELQKPGPFDGLRPHLGWIVAIILALLLVFYKVIEKWVASLIEILGTWFYKRLAGNRRFRRLALRHYRRQLIKKYEELKIAFSERPLLMRDVYVPLKVRGRTSKEQLDAYRAVIKNRRLMILGSPGSGKSMLLKHLAFTYAEGRLTDLPNDPVLLLFDLHKLNENSELSLEQHLTSELRGYDFPHAERFVEQNLQHGSLIILLDGLDEVNSNERGRAISQIKELLEKRRDCRTVITCRNAVYNDEFADLVNQTLEVDEFTDQQIRRFLRPWAEHMSKVGRSVEHLMQTLQDRPRIMSLARNPLMLTMIAYLYTDTPIVLPHSRSEFYRRSTDFLLNKWHQDRNRYESRDKQVILEHLALFFQDSAGLREHDRRSVDFQTVMEQVKLVLPKLNLNPEENVRPILGEIVERSDLLRAIDNNERYQFAHLTLQEYFAAERLLDDSAGLFTRFSADPVTWRETVKLWCGLGSDSTLLIQKVYADDAITAFECLADAKQVEQTLSDEIVSSFKARLNSSDEQSEAIIQAFGAVAADLRPRGEAVFMFLVDRLEKGDGDERRAAAIALSLTNLPLAVKKLAAHYSDYPEASPALVRMGDLAVPELKKFTQGHDIPALPKFKDVNSVLMHARSHSAKAIDDLYKIGTPQAALALVPLLWGQDRNLAARAAYRLGSLLSQPNIEEALHAYALTGEESHITYYSWVWEPIKKPLGSSLPIIAGRITKIIDDSLLKLEDSEINGLDPRIVIPLLIQELNRNAQFKLSETRSPDDVMGKALTNFKKMFENYDGTFWKEISTEEKLQISEKDFRKLLLLYKVKTDARLMALFGYLSLETKFLLPQKFIPLPLLSDWKNLNEPVSYEILKGWHYRIIKLIIAALSLISIIMVGEIIFHAATLFSWKNLLLILAAIGIIPSNVMLGVVDIPQDILFFLLPFYNGVKFTIWRTKYTLKNNGFLSATSMLLLCFLLFLIYQPLILYFGSLFMLQYLSVPIVAGIWVALIALVFLLYRVGARKDRASRNPLFGILDSPEINAKRMESLFKASPHLQNLIPDTRASEALDD